MKCRYKLCRTLDRKREDAAVKVKNGQQLLSLAAQSFSFTMDLFELQQENCKRLCMGISDYADQDITGADHLQPLYGMQSPYSNKR